MVEISIAGDQVHVEVRDMEKLWRHSELAVEVENPQFTVERIRGAIAG